MSLSDSLSVVFSPQAVALGARRLVDALLAVSVRYALRASPNVHILAQQSISIAHVIYPIHSSRWYIF